MHGLLRTLRSSLKFLTANNKCLQKMRASIATAILLTGYVQYPKTQIINGENVCLFNRKSNRPSM